MYSDVANVGDPQPKRSPKGMDTERNLIEKYKNERSGFAP
jgi:hypothetical protein